MNLRRVRTIFRPNYEPVGFVRAKISQKEIVVISQSRVLRWVLCLVAFARYMRVGLVRRRPR